MKTNYIQKAGDDREPGEIIRVLKKPKRPDGSVIGTAIFDEFLRINLVKLDALRKRKIKEKFFYLDMKMSQDKDAEPLETIDRVEKLESEIQIIDNAISAWVSVTERYREEISYYHQCAQYHKNRVELMAFFNRKFMKDAG